MHRDGAIIFRDIVGKLDSLRLLQRRSATTLSATKLRLSALLCKLSHYCFVVGRKLCVSRYPWSARINCSASPESRRNVIREPPGRRRFNSGVVSSTESTANPTRPGAIETDAHTFAL